MKLPGPVLRLIGVGGFLLWTSAPAGFAIQIYGTDPTVQSDYDRFEQGTFPADPVPNPNFIGSSYDLSGVGWDDANPTQGVTMISSQYFVCANHYGLQGNTLDFENTAGVVDSFAIDPSGYHNLTYSDGTNGTQTSDLLVGRLTSPIPSADLVHAMPILYLGNTQVTTTPAVGPIPATTTLTGFDAYANTTLFVYGRGSDTAHSPRMGMNTLNGFGEYNFGAATDPATNIGLDYDQKQETGQAALEVGDSGSPTFGLKNGAFGLIGTHSGTGTDMANNLPLGVDAFVSYTSYIAQLDAILAADGQQVTLVPEPSSGLLTALGGLGLLGAGTCLARRRVA